VAIYLDASVLRVTLQGPEMSAVRALARAHKQPILIPSIALDEATANRRRDIEAAVNEVQLAIKKASWAFEVPYFRAPAPLALAVSWQKDMLKAADLLPVSPEHAAEALFREIERVPPARKGVGARDAAIWMAVRDHHLGSDQHGYFVTANVKDFANERGHLHDQLAAELVRTDRPLELVKSLADLVAMLGPAPGTDVAFDALAESKLVKQQVWSVVHQERGIALPIDELLEASLGRRVRWSGVTWSLRLPSLVRISAQRAYKLPDGRELAIIETDWLMWVDIRITGPRELVDSGIQELEAAVMAKAEIWAERDPATNEMRFEVSSVGPLLVPVQPSSILTSSELVLPDDVPDP
jgi:PIN domain